MSRRYIIVIPVDKMQAANTDADKVDKGKTGKTFTMGLSTDGYNPPTHYWCNWNMSDDEVKELAKDFDPVKSGDKHQAKMFDAAIWTPDEVLKQLGLVIISPDAIKRPTLITKIITAIKNIFKG